METSKYIKINIRLILNSLSKSKSILMFDDINSGEQSTEDLEFYKKEMKKQVSWPRITNNPELRKWIYDENCEVVNIECHVHSVVHKFQVV